MELETSGQAWLTWRNRGIGSSDSPIICGLSPYKDIETLWAEKCGIKKQDPPNYAMQRGTNLEAFARDIYEFQFDKIVPPKNFEHKKYPFLRASVDGYCEKDNFIIEIKSPLAKRKIEAAKTGDVPIEYIPQIQHQLMVTEAKFCHYVTYDGEENIYVAQVWPDLRFQRKLMWLERWFWAKIQAKSEITKRPRVLHV